MFCDNHKSVGGIITALALVLAIIVWSAPTAEALQGVIGPIGRVKRVSSAPNSGQIDPVPPPT
jgi:hypothetical protein